MSWVGPCVAHDDVPPKTACTGVEEVLAVELALGVSLCDERLIVGKDTIVSDKGRCHVDKIGPANLKVELLAAR